MVNSYSSGNISFPMPRDETVRLGNSLVQHGPLNNRVYLMDLDPRDSPAIVSRLEGLAADKGYSKIFARIRDNESGPFQDEGYITEAFVPRMFRGFEHARFMALYLDESRLEPRKPELLNNVLRAARTAGRREPKPRSSQPMDGYCLVRMGPELAQAMADLFSRVFDSYAFPVFDPEYLRKSMQKSNIYSGMEYRGSLAGLAGAEISTGSLSAEMTDFAVLPGHRGRGLAGLLLDHLSTRLAGAGVLTLYSIARAASMGMNLVFARAGYEYAGTLVNNTHINGRLESMNVWYRPLEQ